MAGRSKTLTYGLPAVGLVALGLGASWVWADQPADRAETPPRAPVESPGALGLTQASRFIGATGLVEPAGEAVAVAVHSGGVVAEVAVAAGDVVGAGQLLLRLGTRAFENELAAARAAVDEARAQRATLVAERGMRRAEVDAAAAEVASAQAALASAQSAADDAQNRFDNAAAIDDPRAISAEAVASRRFAADGAAAQVRAADSALAGARANHARAAAALAMLVAADGRDGPRVREAGQAVERALAEQALAQTRLDLRRVVAPAAGRVYAVDVRVGEYAALDGGGVVTLGSADTLHVRAQLDEVDVVRFEPGAPAWASPRGDGSARWPLALHRVEPRLVAKTSLTGGVSERIDTRVLEVVYALPPEAAAVYVGQQMDVFITAQREDSE